MSALRAPRVTGAPAGAPAAVTIACAGCGYRAESDEPYPATCPRRVANDDVDHVMTRRIDPSRLRFPTSADTNPFVRYRELFRAWHVARDGGWPDRQYGELVERLDRAVADVDGHGFRITPFERSGPVSDRLGFTGAGGVWVKDETGNVAGSHKARHLFGALLELLVDEALGRIGPPTRPLAIASCGNAALAAAVVARAAGRRLDVFVPTTADPVIVDRLNVLGARISTCPREPGTIGDPTHARLRDAVSAGAIPFTCQGTENGLTIEGGETIGFEIVSALAREGRALDRLVVQVGGGALASACAAAFEEAHALGGIDRIPRLDTVQTEGGWPLRRAWEQIAERLRRRGVPVNERARGPLDPDDPIVAEELAYAARHRSAYMWPWETEPRSVAGGILDDETYDWHAVVRAMLATGGAPVVVDEETLLEANELAHETTGIDADHTGTAGLAGLIALLRRGEVRPDETVAVLFTGIRRGPRPDGAITSPNERSEPS